MRQVFIVPGYGVPKDILKDLNMTLYLRAVANFIFDQSADSPQPIVIFTGGPTDMQKPYRLTEAREMHRWMKQAIRARDFRKSFRTWRIRVEPKSLSTLENALFSAKYIPAGSRVTVFTEYTRVARWKFILKKLRIRRARVVAIDFDASANRYRGKQVRDKEQAMRRFDAWALKNKTHLRKHHEFFVKRIEYLRAADPKNHVEAVHRFWQEGVSMLPPEIKAILKRHA